MPLHEIFGTELEPNRLRLWCDRGTRTGPAATRVWPVEHSVKSGRDMCGHVMMIHILRNYSVKTELHP